ncbi:thiamine transporter 2-like [Genypterus blacodes]|uniref:thiamine transporter 2-like n=1 Tax=Genypterus blacodes TaxID=154954 RepID=UPI003F776612
MGFCWSGECGNKPGCGPCCAGWVGPTALLCVYGFCSMMRPIEPFMTEFLTGTDKNLTTEQVMRGVYPVWTYANLILLVPVFLVTDFLRYKPVIVLQGLSYVTAFLLILVGSGLRCTQAAFFANSVAAAADVAYFAYIYTVVQPCYYQRVTSYVRGAILVGYATGALLAQLLVSVGGASLHCLAVVSLTFVSMALMTSIFLPMPKTSLFRGGTYYAQRETSAEDESSDSVSDSIWVKSTSNAKHLGRLFRGLLLDCKECYSSVALLFFCVWVAAGRCGFYQVANYIQVLWVHQQPGNFTAYNGGVDSISTLSGAAATIAVGHVSLEWSVWVEVVLGGFTALMAASLFLMDWADNIWISYAGYMLFKTLYMLLATICTFQIARMLSRGRYALVFGVNSFVGTVLQSVLTAVVINTKSLRLTITSQFFIYTGFFAAIALLFTIRGGYTVFHVRKAAAGELTERASTLPEVSRP